MFSPLSKSNYQHCHCTFVHQGAVHTSHDDSAAYEDHYTTGGTAFMRLGQTNSKLYLECVTNRDEGEYTCVAETPMLRKTQTTQVKVGKFTRSHIAMRQFLMRIHMHGLTKMCIRINYSASYLTNWNVGILHRDFLKNSY